MSFLAANSSVLIAPWGGFKVCAGNRDCIADGGSLYSLVLTCSVMEDSPFPGQKVCHCDLGLGGAECTEITPQAVYKLVFLLIGLLISVIVTCYGLVELCHRGIPTTSTPILQSLR
jgi:hypothetical protein